MDPSLIVAGKLIAPTFVKNLLDNSKGLFKNLSAELQQAFSDKLSSYLSKYELNYSYTKTILHRHEPVPFYDLYFPVKLERRDANNNGQRIEIETSSVSNIFLRTNFITVTGSAGSGKSTLAKHIFLNSMKAGMGIPVLVELRNLVYYNGSFYDYLKSIIFANDLAKNESIFERLLAAGKFVFLIDGFDEVKREFQNSVLKQISDFVSKYDYNRFMLTSRPGANLDLFPSFHNYRMKEMEGSEIYDFIRKQKLSAASSESVINYLEKNNSGYLSSYLSNPLLLTLYLVTYTNNSSIPNKRSVFYRRVFEVLLREHDTATKIGYERDLLTKLTQEKIEDILKMFSFITFFDNHYNFDRDYLIKKLSETKERLKKKYSSFSDFDIEHLTYDLKVAIGIWVQDETYIYFIHRSMQEYFAATFISTINTNKKAVYEKIVSKIDYLNRTSDVKGFKNIVGYSITNFLLLCQEVDEFSFYQYVKIPIMKQLIDSLNTLTEQQQIALLLEVSGLDCFLNEESPNNFKIMMMSYINNKYQIIDEVKDVFFSVKFYDYIYTIPRTIQYEIGERTEEMINGNRPFYINYDLHIPLFLGVENVDWIPNELYKILAEESKKVIKELNNSLCVFETHVRGIEESDSGVGDLI